MYAFLDQPIRRLDNSGRFFLWAMRAWIGAMQKGGCPQAALAPAFARMGSLTALRDLHMALSILNRDSRSRVELAPIRHGRVTEDEALLLGLWRDVACGSGDRARDMLRLLVNDDAVDMAARAMSLTVTHLAEIGMGPVGLLPLAAGDRL